MASKVNPQQFRAAESFHQLLTDTLDDLAEKVQGIHEHRQRKIRQSLDRISTVYTQLLSDASVERPRWNDPANRCAYVFLYLMQHCNIVFSSLQLVRSEISRSWQDKNDLKVCSIGGGPGSDLVGLTKFLRECSIFPRKLDCVVLDRYPEWKDTWKILNESITELFEVTYSRCDLVNDSVLDGNTRQSVVQADMVTIVKFFSVVAAFYREDRSKGNIFRSLLRDLKRGCFVLYIDKFGPRFNFQEAFAEPAGLRMVADWRKNVKLPYIDRSEIIKKYTAHLNRQPLRECEVDIQLYRKM